MLDIADEILRIMIHANFKCVATVRFVCSDESHRCRVAIGTENVRLEVVLAIVKAHTGFPPCNTRVYGHDLSLAAREPHTELAHLPGVRTQEEVRERKTVVVFSLQSLPVELEPRFFRRFPRDDVHDTADCVRAVLCTRRTLGDLDALDVLRAETHDLVRST